ncbi:MAG: YerC/YecD family TrpR-related protein [Faecalibacterium sp.]|nr:YerC/YecD family TrpR-related protein [Ruminococcus sp.]MCM1392589.1 YerC/YecD family TrpR-related protein [Ruminococcus sp.]MCM1486281.1 YerC/YecD family TrpR-related protein [Faecalibacterium sp.]
MPGKNIQENIDYLYKTILSIETYEECEAFFDDMCTKTELASMAQRLVVAKMLTDKHVYSDIVNETGASTATISRVNRSLAFGKGGYDKIFSKTQDNGEK